MVISCGFLSLNMWSQPTNEWSVTTKLDHNQDVYKMKRASVTGEVPAFETKEEHAYVSNIQMQKSTSENTLRFVSAIKVDQDEANQYLYEKYSYGFHVQYGTKDIVYPVQYIYNSIIGNGVRYLGANSSILEGKSIDEWAGKSGYTHFIALTIKEIPEVENNTRIQIQPIIDLGSGYEAVGKVTQTNYDFIQQSIGSLEKANYRVAIGNKDYAFTSQDGMATLEDISFVKDQEIHFYQNGSEVAVEFTNCTSISEMKEGQYDISWELSTNRVTIKDLQGLDPIIEHTLKKIDGVSATCDKEGTVEHYRCEKCGILFLDAEGKNPTESIVVPALGHSFKNATITAPTTEEEGSMLAECDHGCGTTIQKKILRRAKNLQLVGMTLSWDAITNAETYEVVIGEDVVDAGENTSISLTEAQAKAIGVREENVVIRGVTSSEEYVKDEAGALLTKEKTLGENTGSALNYNFETSRIKVNRTAAFDQYPYGNYSDMDNNVGGWYYIEQDGANNTALKIPAVVWYPGNTTVKKAITGDAAKAGEYEISFDIKASQKALDAHSSAGKYGTIKGYMWDTGFHEIKIAGTSTLFNGAGLVVKDIPGISTTEYTNVRLRYTLTADSANLFNTFNLVYWPEAYIGEDNYVWVDNIQVFRVTDGVVGTTNVDASGKGDLESWGFHTKLDANRWYLDNKLLIENSSIGSEIVTEENGNRCLKTYCNKEDVAFDLRGDASLIQPGLYNFSFRLKCGAAYKPANIDVTAWTFKNGQATQLFDWFGLDISKVNADGWITVSGTFFNKGVAESDTINIFINENNRGTVSDHLENYLLFDDFSLQTVSYR